MPPVTAAYFIMNAIIYSKQPLLAMQLCLRLELISGSTAIGRSMALAARNKPCVPLLVEIAESCIANQDIMIKILGEGLMEDIIDYINKIK